MDDKRDLAKYKTVKMKKLILHLNLVALILFSAASCTSSEPDSVATETFPISDFSSLNLELIGEVFYEQADSFYLHASGSSILIEALKVSDSKGELSIGLKNRRKYSSSKKELVIRVGSPRLRSITFKSIGTLHLKNYFAGDELSIINHGVGKIKIDDCQVGTFNLTSKSLGLVEAKGRANKTFIDSDGLGKIDFSEFESKNTTVISTGVGNLSVYARESIDISVSGIGNVSYYGNPEEVKTDVSGMGKITRVER